MEEQHSAPPPSSDWPTLLPSAVAKILDSVPDSVRAAIVSVLQTQPSRARGMLEGICLGRSAGAQPVRALGEGVLRFRGADGPFAVAALSFETAPHPLGQPEDVRQLIDVLDGTFQQRHYALYVRRAIPAGMDPGPVAQAVQLWLAAIDRGEWKGRHAIYEDEDVALELTLVKQHAERSRRVMTVGPITSLERLGAVDAMVVEQAQQDLGVPNLPMVVLLSARPAWRIPRGYTEQLLYGTADRTEASLLDNHYQAEFQANGRSLFSDPACAHIAGLWWTEGTRAQPTNELRFHARAYSNPWCDAPGVPTVDVDRFELSAQQPVERCRLRWVRSEVPHWDIL